MNVLYHLEGKSNTNKMVEEDKMEEEEEKKEGRTRSEEYMRHTAYLLQESLQKNGFKSAFMFRTIRKLDLYICGITCCIYICAFSLV